MAPALAQEKNYTGEDYNNLPETVRAELIEGRLYYMSAPSRMHQRILGIMYNKIFNYISVQSLVHYGRVGGELITPSYSTISY